MEIFENMISIMDSEILEGRFWLGLSLAGPLQNWISLSRISVERGEKSGGVVLVLLP